MPVRGLLKNFDIDVDELITKLDASGEVFAQSEKTMENLRLSYLQWSMLDLERTLELDPVLQSQRQKLGCEKRMSEILIPDLRIMVSMVQNSNKEGDRLYALYAVEDDLRRVQNIKAGLCPDGVPKAFVQMEEQVKNLVNQQKTSGSF